MNRNYFPKGFSLFLFFVLIPFHVFSQGFTWLSSVSGGSNTATISTQGVVSDNQGNTYITGKFRGTAFIGSTILTGSGDEIFIAKLDPAGNIVWIETAGGTGEDAGMDIVLDNQGGLYVSGIFSNTASFGTTTVTAVANRSDLADNFLAKYDTTGNFQWIKTGGSTVSSGGNTVYVNYYGRSKLKYQDGFVYLYSSNAITNLTTPVQRTFDGTVLPNSSIAVPAFTIVLNNFVLKTSTAGVNSWIKPIYSVGTNSSYCFPSDIEIKSNGHVVLQTMHSSTILVDSTFVVGPPSTSTGGIPFNQLISELDTAGNFYDSYATSRVGSYFNGNFSSFGLAIDNFDNTYFSTTSDFNSPRIIGGVSIPVNSIFITKLDTLLSPINSTVLADVQNNNSRITALEIRNDQLILGGVLLGLINFNGTVFSRNQEFIFANIDTSLNSLNWFTSTQSDYTNTLFVDPPDQGIYDIELSSDGAFYFSGATGVVRRNFDDLASSSNSTYDGFLVKMISCKPIAASISPLNPVICGTGSSITLNATYNPALDVSWLYSGSVLNGSISNSYTTTNTGVYTIVVDSLGCKDTSNVVNVTFSQVPNVSTPNTTLTVCANSGTFSIPGGTPSGGIWSGTGVVNDTLFNPAVVGSGPSLLTYTYTNPSGCVGSAIQIANVVAPPSLLVASSLPSFCEGDPVYPLNSTVFPGGGTYSGPGVVANSFDPSIAGAGTHLISYYYAGATGCADSTSFILVVNPSPVLTFPSINPLCQTNFAIPLSTALPVGGTYSGPFVISNNFYPFLSGIGTFPITYSITQNGCTTSETQNIQVDPLPVAVLTNPGDFCLEDAEDTLVGGVPSGGFYRIDGTVSTTINPQLLGVGLHQLEYVYTNSCGTDIDTQSFEVFAMPVVTVSSIGPLCENDQDITLNIGLPIGGIYSGLGVTGTTFSPTTVGAGIFSTNYLYTDNNGCSAVDSVAITVNTAPVASATIDTVYCINDAASNLTASPAGGVWSGNGLSSNSFEPSIAGVGTHPLTYIVSNGQGCFDTLTKVVEVNNIPIVSLSTFPSICNSNSSAIVLTGGLPAGGTYSGLGVSNGAINPNIVGAGIHPISYTYTDSLGCTTSATQNILVDTTTVSVTQTDFSDVCTDLTSLALTGGSPVGGFYTGLGVVNDTFYPSFVGPGIYNLTYSYTATNACVATIIKPIQVNALPSVSLATLADRCLNDSTFAFTEGSPSGGIYTGFGVVNGTFSPSNLGAGTYEIQYTYVDSNTCTAADTSLLKVNALPTMALSLPDNLCANNGLLTLNSGLPLGGIYSGTGVLGNTFDPSTSGLGSVPIAYTYTDSNSCTNRIEDTIRVNSTPIVSIQGDSLICEGDSVNLLVNGASTYQWSTGDTTNQLTLNPINGTTYSVVGLDSNACMGMDTFSVFVNTLNISVDSVDAICNGDLGLAVVFATGNGTTYNYNWSNGATTDSIFALAGSFCVTVTDDNACVAETCVRIEEPTALTATVVDNGNGSATASALGGTGAYNYLWDNGDNLATSSSLTLGASNCVTITDANACIDTACVFLVLGLDKMSDKTISSINIYPNPTSGNAFVQLDLANTQHVQLDLLDAIGRVLTTQILGNIQSQQIELSTNALPSGVYFIRFIIDNEIHTKRLIVEKG